MWHFSLKRQKNDCSNVERFFPPIFRLKLNLSTWTLLKQVKSVMLESYEYEYRQYDITCIFGIFGQSSLRCCGKNFQFEQPYKDKQLLRMEQVSAISLEKYEFENQDMSKLLARDSFGESRFRSKGTLRKFFKKEKVVDWDIVEWVIETLVMEKQLID